MSLKSAYKLLIVHVMLTGLYGTLDSLSLRITNETGITPEKINEYKAVFNSVFEEIDICEKNISSALTELLSQDKSNQT